MVESIDWSWMAEEDPEDKIGIITIKHKNISISFDMESFSDACNLIKMIESLLHSTRSDCINEISIAVNDVISQKRYS